MKCQKNTEIGKSSFSQISCSLRTFEISAWNLIHLCSTHRLFITALISSQTVHYEFIFNFSCCPKSPKTAALFLQFMKEVFSHFLQSCCNVIGSAAESVPSLHQPPPPPPPPPSPEATVPPLRWRSLYVTPQFRCFPAFTAHFCRCITALWTMWTTGVCTR